MAYLTFGLLAPFLGLPEINATPMWKRVSFMGPVGSRILTSSALPLQLG